jgi:hypothetical protein
MSAPPLPMIITDAGRAALAAAAGTAAVTIAEAGFTASAFLAAPTITALPGEFKRVAAVSGEAVDVTTIHLTVRDDAAQSYTVRGFALYLADGTLFAVYSQPTPILGKIDASTFFLAIDVKVQPGDAEIIEFGDTGFLNPPATEHVKGVAYIATLAEVLAGFVADKMITPATLKAILNNYVAANTLGMPYGVATLGPDGKLLLSQRPPIDLIDVWPVPNQAAMLALAASVGDFAVRADNGLVYVLQATPAATLGNWLEISTPAPVSSVNSKTGAVVLTAGDVGAVPVARQVIVSGGVLQGGGGLGADININLPIASQPECAAGAIGDKVVTPSGLGPLLVSLLNKVPLDRNIGSSGLLKGGRNLADHVNLYVEAASAAELLAAAEGGKAVTPASFGGLPRSLTPNGYVTLPGGLKWQWVQYRGLLTFETAIEVYYPTSFAEFVVPLSCTGWTANFSNVRDMWMLLQGEPGLGSCNVQTQTDDGADNRLDGFNLVLFGK